MASVNSQSEIREKQVEAFLESARLPVRLAFADGRGNPRICSLWYIYRSGSLWAASHGNAYLIKKLTHNNRVSFEVSTNDYPYKGVRGTALATLDKRQGGEVLDALIEKYLGNSNRTLADWLKSRSGEEYAVKIEPLSLSAWDFSSRMEK